MALDGANPMEKIKTVDEILEGINNRLPVDDEIVRVYSSSRSVIQVNLLIADLYLAISELEDSQAKNQKLYRKKKRLEYYCSQLDKRAKYLNEIRLKQALKNKVKTKTKQEVLDLLSQGLLNHVIKSTNLQVARTRLQDLNVVKQDLQISARQKESDREFTKALNHYMQQGMELRDALKQVEKDLKSPQYTMPMGDISEFDPNKLNLDVEPEVQKKLDEGFRLDRLNIGSDLMNEPLATEINPIRLDHDPNRNHKED